MKKKLTLVLSLALAVAIGIGGTLAYLTARTDPITNTFTIGNVGLTLAETTGTSYKMTPNTDISKDPVVTVTANSEKSYVFVKLTKGTNVDNYLEYSIDSSVWTALPEVEGVWYKVVDNSTTDTRLNVLTNAKVHVRDTVSAIAAGDTVTLTFQAFAIQYDGIADVNTAWTTVSSAYTG